MAKWEAAPLAGDGAAPVGKWASAPLADAQPVQPTGTVPALLEGAAQGLSFGFSDELEGLARALVDKYASGSKKSFGELYDEAVSKPRRRIAAAQATNPLAFYGGEIGSALAVPSGLAGLGIRGAVSGASGAGLGARTLAGAREGAAYGAAYGAGTAQGGITDRLSGAAQGGLVGGAVGAAVPGAVDLAGAALQRVATPVRSVMNPRGVAAEKLEEAVARDLSTTPGVYGDSAQQFADRFGRMADVNPQVRLADAGGENVRGLMRSATNMPNEMRDTVKRAVDTRQAGQWSRIENSLTGAMNEPRNFYDSVAAVAQRMDEIGAEKIAPALRVETPITPQLASVLDRPTARELRSVVERKIADEGRPIGFETRTEMLHRMKMELDEQIGMARRAETMGNRPQAGWDVRTLTVLKRDLLNAIDNPAYKDGLKNYASQARLTNAAEDGFDNFMRQAPEQIRETLRRFDTDAERDMYRMGALRAIVDKVRTGNVTRDRTDGVFSSPAMQLRLKELMPSQKQYREFQRSLVVEAKMADTRKAIQGNSTTARQLAEGDEAGKAARGLSSVINAASGRLEPVLNLVGNVANRFSGMTPGVAAETLRLGMSRDPILANALAQAGMERAARVPAQRAAVSDAMIAAGGTFGGAATPLEVMVYPPGDPRNYR